MAQGRGFAPPVFFSNPFFSFSARKKRTVSNCQEKKEDAQNRKCIPCRHRVRRSQLHSVSAGAAKTPYPQPSSSFPNCDRFTGSQFGHLEFYNAARDLDDGAQTTFTDTVCKGCVSHICKKETPKGFRRKAKTEAAAVPQIATVYKDQILIEPISSGLLKNIL